MSDTALIVVDMQNAYFAANGSLARRDQAICSAQALFARVNELVRFARARGMTIIFTRMVLDPAADEPTPEQCRIRSQPGRDRDYLPDSIDVQLADLPARRPDDRIVNKSRYDAFHDSELEHSLRSEGVTRLLFAGVLTNLCVESCVRSAFERGFDVTVVSDATATYSEDAKAASLAVVERSFGRVLSLADLASST